MANRHRLVRLDWVDAARGYSVLAVVLFHVLLWRSQWRGIVEDPLVWGLWGSVNQALGRDSVPAYRARGYVRAMARRRVIRHLVPGYSGRHRPHQAELISAFVTEHGCRRSSWSVRCLSPRQ